GGREAVLLPVACEKGVDRLRGGAGGTWRFFIAGSGNCGRKPHGKKTAHHSEKRHRAASAEQEHGPSFRCRHHFVEKGEWVTRSASSIPRLASSVVPRNSRSDGRAPA